MLTGFPSGVPEIILKLLDVVTKPIGCAKGIDVIVYFYHMEEEYN